MSLIEKTHTGIAVLLTSILASLFSLGAVWGCTLLWSVFPLPVKIFVGIVAFVPSYLLVMGLTFLTVKGYRIATEYTAYHVSEDGMYVLQHGVLKGYASLRGSTPLKQLGTKVEDITSEIPRLTMLLQDEMLVTEREEVLLGYRTNGTPRYGIWPSVFAMTGIGNSGKSISMVLFIVIALIKGYEVIVCDPHKTKERSIYNKLNVLEGYIRFAFSTDEILHEALTFSRELKAKKQGIDSSHKKLLVIDELTSLVKRTPALSKQLVTVVEEASQEGMGYNHNIMLACHTVTEDGIGDVAIRNALNGVFCHRLDSDQSKYVIKDKRYYKRSGNLPSGHVFYRDELHEIEYLIMPFSDASDMKQALKILQDKGLLGQAGSVAGSISYQKIPALTQPAYISGNGSGNAEMTTEMGVNVGLEPLYPNPSHISRVNLENEGETPFPDNGNDVREMIQRLHSKHVKLGVIAYAVGLSGRRYGEFKEICSELGIDAKKDEVA